MNEISNSDVQIHKLDHEGNIAASYSGITADTISKGGTVSIEMLESMGEAIRMKDELTDDKSNTFIMTFGSETQRENKKFKGIIKKCIINPFNCERIAFEAEIKICSDPEDLE